MLEDLHDGLPFESFLRVFPAVLECRLEAHIWRHASIGQIAVVRNREVIATCIRRARCIEFPPQQTVVRRIDIRHRQLGHVGISKHDIAVIVGRARCARVLVGNETSEGTGCRPVIRLIRGLRHVLPGCTCILTAQLTVLAANLGHPEWRFRRDDLTQHQHALALTLPCTLAERRVVSRRTLLAAQATFAEKFAVVGHGQKIQRPVDGETTARRAILIEGPEVDGLSLGVQMGIHRCGSDAVGGRIEGEVGVHVQITEQRQARFGVVVARQPFLGVRHGALHRLLSFLGHLCPGRCRLLLRRPFTTRCQQDHHQSNRDITHTRSPTLMPSNCERSRLAPQHPQSRSNSLFALPPGTRLRRCSDIGARRVQLIHCADARIDVRVVRTPQKLILSHQVALHVFRRLRWIHHVPELLAHVFARQACERIQPIETASSRWMRIARSRNSVSG